MLGFVVDDDTSEGSSSDATIFVDDGVECGCPFVSASFLDMVGDEGAGVEGVEEDVMVRLCAVVAFLVGCVTSLLLNSIHLHPKIPGEGVLCRRLRLMRVRVLVVA